MVNYTCEVPQAYLLSPTGDYGCFASFVTDFLVLNSPLDSTHSKCQYSTGGFQLCPTKRRKVKLHAHVWQKCFVSQKPDIEFSREVGYSLITVQQTGQPISKDQEDSKDLLAEISLADHNKSRCRGNILAFSHFSSPRKHILGTRVHDQDASVIVNEPISDLRASEPGAAHEVKQPTHLGKGPPWRHLLAGAASGAVSRTITAPLETLRLQAITGTASHSNLLHAAKSIVRKRGWRALYRGNFLNVVRAAPQKALDFFSFEIYKDVLGARTSKSMYPTFTSAALAGATSCLTLHPLEVLRSRVTCDSQGQYRGLVSSTRQIVRSEGVGALYRGLGPALLAIIPEAAITYGMFDGLKRLYASKTQQKEAGLVPSIACGVVSSFTGQMLAFPFEAVSRRLQIEQAAVAQLGSIAFVSNLLRHQGPLGLYRGIGAAILKVVPMATISFSTYELACLWLAHLDAKAASENGTGLELRAT